MKPRLPHSTYRVYYRTNLWPQSIAFYNEMIRQNPTQFPVLVKPNDMVAYRGNEFWWIRETEPLRRALSQWEQQWIATPAHYEAFRNERFEGFNAARSTIAQLPRLINAQLSDTILSDYYQQCINTAESFMTLVEYTVDAFDDHFGALLTSWLNANATHPIAAEHRNDFFAVAPLSGISEYRKIMLQYTLHTLQEQLTPHDIALRYSWISMGWDGKGELTIEEVERTLHDLQKQPTQQLHAELESIMNHSSRVHEQRVVIKQLYGLPDEPLESYWRLMDDFASFHDARKEIQMRAVQVILRILRVLEQQHPIVYEDLQWYTVSEIVQLIEKHQKVSNQILSTRQRGLVYEIHDEHVTEYTGIQASEIIDTLILPHLNGEQQQRVTGMPATKGEVNGRAFVSSNAVEANAGIGEGDVLIANSTGVEFLPAMQKAAGIITDDGGITSHAAVVSRELGIPCIVGTKNATHVFATGDTVYLNATEGYAERKKERASSQPLPPEWSGDRTLA